MQQIIPNLNPPLVWESYSDVHEASKRRQGPVLTVRSFDTVLLTGGSTLMPETNCTIPVDNRKKTGVKSLR